MLTTYFGSTGEKGVGVGVGVGWVGVDPKSTGRRNYYSTVNIPSSVSVELV